MATTNYASAPTVPPETDTRPWWRQLTSYHWFVFIVASSAWFFDCLDQRIFSMARTDALVKLMGLPASDPAIAAAGKIVTACFLVGWGCGGMIFGVLADKFGRSKMLAVVMFVYAFFTGMCYFSQNEFQFALFRGLTGLGIGGVFGLAVALVAETVPGSARAASLGMLQILSTIGNCSAVGVFYAFNSMSEGHVLPSAANWWGQPWRWMFLASALPAMLVILLLKWVKEPERWLELKREGRLPKGSIIAPYIALINDGRWRRNLVCGALIAATGVIGLWAIAEYLVDLYKTVFDNYYLNVLHMPAADAKHAANNAKNLAYILYMLGAGTGMWIFSRVTVWIGRKPSFLIGFSTAMVATIGIYWFMRTPMDAYWMSPLIGAAQLSVFAGFAIYLPELFPGRLRGTGTSFCYNIGRFAAAAGSFFSGYLTSKVYVSFAKTDPSMPARLAAITMSALFLIGLCTLPFAPETKGKPLPE